MRWPVRRFVQCCAVFVSLTLATFSLPPAELARAQTPPVVPGPASPAAEAQALAARAERLGQQGQHAAAEPLYRRVLEIDRAARGEQDPGLAVDYNNLAMNLSAQGRYRDAEPFARRMLEILRAGLGEQDPSTATGYDNLASNLDDQGRYADAEPLYRRALEIRRAALGEQDPVTADSYNNVAFNLNAQGRYADAEPLFRRALATFRAVLGEQHATTLTGYNNLASNLAAQGRNTEAEPLLRRALETRRAVLGEQDPNTAVSYSNLAVNLDGQGKPAEAEPLFRRALETLRAALGGAHPYTAGGYANLARNLEAQGKHAEAEPLFRLALDTRRATLGEPHPDTTTSYNNLATDLSAQGRLAAAEQLFRHALASRRAVLGEQNPDTAASYGNLAANLDAQGRAAEAVPLHRRALEIRRALLGEQHPDTVLSYSNLAFSLNELGLHGEALPFSRQAAMLVRERRARAGAQIATTAEGALARAKDRDGTSDPLDFVFGTLLNTTWRRALEAPAETPALRGEAFTAAQDLDASSVGRAMAQTAARTAAGGGSLGQVARRQQDLSAALRRLDGQNIAALGRGDAAAAQAYRAQINAQSRDLAAVNAQLAKDFPQYADLVSPKALSLAQVQARLRADEGLLLIVPGGGSIYSFAVSGSRVAWARADGIAAATRARVALLRCQADEDACGREPPAQSCVRVNPPGEAAPTPAGPAFDRASAYCLYHDLIAPVEAALDGVSKLYVTASGPLSSLPLSVLITAPPGDGAADSDPVVLARGRWLADRYALTTLPTVSSLQAPARGKPAHAVGGSAFLGYGAPTLGGEAGPADGRGGIVISPETGFFLADPRSLKVGLAALPGTEVELRAMALVLQAPAGSVRLGEAATERAVRADPRLPIARVIAFATHGLLPTDHIPGLQEPGLVFTPPGSASDADDGVLAASEVSRMSFNADWIILSACNTAAADGTPGADSLSSLARAFLYAGAQALLASHWRVSDEVTAALTVETLAIRRDHPELTRAQALQLAMRNVRTGRRADGTRVAGWNESWTHPAAWAPFSVIANEDR